jgi:hypothetical protein
MKARVSYSVPMLHVMDVERALKFYELLGFVATNVLKDPAGKAVWAWLSCHRGEVAERTIENESAAVMLAQASHPVDAGVQAVLLYMYSADLPGLREHLLANGVEASEIEHRFYMEKGEMRVTDPDGYVVLVGQI